MTELRSICEPSKRDYADRWDLDRVFLQPCDYRGRNEHPSFQKLYHIHRYLFWDGYDAVFWMDADSVITNPDFDPSEMAQCAIDCGNWPFVVSGDYKRPEEDPRQWWSQWSAGHALWFNDGRSRALLECAMRKTEFAWSGLWDQDALQACLSKPYDPWRPQILPARSMNSVLPGLTGWDQADWQPGDLLCHFTGIDPKDRPEVARRFIAEHLTNAKP